LLSCSSNSKQIDVVKNKISTYTNVEKEEIKDYEFEVYEVSSKEAYSRLVHYYGNKANIVMKEGDLLGSATSYLEKSKKYLDLEASNPNLKFHIVNAYHIVAKDTVFNEDFYLNENDSIITKHKGI